jgi:hypothetical protein
MKLAASFLVMAMPPAREEGEGGLKLNFWAAESGGGKKEKYWKIM